jgi:hypothetical protein
MKNGDHSFKNDHGFEFVSYIYGELDRPGREAFEAHLATCDECAMELAVYSDARLGVIEWRREDFDHLETPVIVVPLMTEKRSTAVIEREPVRTFTGFVEALTSIPVFARAGLGLATASLAIGVAYFVAYPPSEKNLAVNNKTETESVTSRGKDTNSDITPFVAGKDDKTEARELIPISPYRHFRRQLAAIKIGDRRSPVHRSELASTHPISNASSKKAPRLSSVDEEDDKTLRLADLFAEIGTSEE